MTINSIPEIKYIPKSHRCHGYVLDFVVATCSVGSYMNAYNNLPVTTFAPHIQAGAPQYPNASFQGLASGKTVNFVPHDVLTSVFVDNHRNEDVPYTETAFSPISGVFTDAAADAFAGFAQAMFTQYWEANLDEINRVHGTRKQGNWPPVLKFAAVIRDAMSHGGKIHMFPTVASVAYFGLNYSQSDNGKKVIHAELSTADIFFLMLDVDAAF